MKRHPLSSLVLAALCLAAPAVPAAAAPGSFITLLQVANFTSPIGVTNAGDGSGRLFVVEQCGRIRIRQGSSTLTTPFLDLGTSGADRISCGGERGLLGLAFHPDYETNGRFFVYYTRKSDGDVVIARYQVSAGNPNVANPASEAILLVIEHSSQGNHNGGGLAFGPDGYLYIAVGDGGGGGDPFESGQNINTHLGKLLRVDVDQNVNTVPFYGIPPDNPFAGATAGLDEIFHYGLRNPWRFSFDRTTGDLFIGDVGQNAWEEIDFRAAGSPGGVNFGWDCREAAHPYNDQDDVVNNPPIFNSDCTGRTFVDPILEYSHSLGCSVTGGYVYRGGVKSSLLLGNYIYGDLCSRRVWRGIPGAGGTWTSQQLTLPALSNLSLTSFGESESGRIYITYVHGTTAANGTLHWLAPYSFADVTPTHFAWPFVEALFTAGVTSGCGGDNFCPSSSITRGEMAVFLLLSLEGEGYNPPPCTTPTFSDVPCTSPFAAWINELAARNVTAGCGGGNYCPDNPVTREQMSVFLLRTLEGTSYSPPACTTARFSDVPCSSPFAPWVNEIATRGVTAGCGGTSFCPGDAVTRAQMAVFLTTTFSLPVP